MCAVVLDRSSRSAKWIKSIQRAAAREKPVVAKVILVGTDLALLEGLAQTLVGFGHAVSFATTVAEAAGSLSADLPALAVVSSQALEEGGFGMTLPLTPGGALIVYGTSHTDRPFLPTKLQRATLAHLVLPLERHRLVALVQSFESRSRTTGRSTRDEPGDDFYLQADPRSAL